MKGLHAHLIGISALAVLLGTTSITHAQPLQQSPPPPRYRGHFQVLMPLKTGITLEKGEFVRMTADGIIDFGDFTPAGDPEGIRTTGLFRMMYNHFPDVPHGALMAQIGDSTYYHIGTSNEFLVKSKGELLLFVNDKDPSNNTGGFTVSVEVFAVKSYQQRLAELNEIRSSHDLDALTQWLKENPDWTNGLPLLPKHLSMPPNKNNGGLDPNTWEVDKLSSLSPHIGVWEVRQIRDVPGQKFPGVGAQGLYDAQGRIIESEGTPDIASPRDVQSTWNHLHTDYALYNRFIENYGPLVGEIKYRELYQVDVPEQYLSPAMYEAQKKWEQDQVDKQIGPEP